MLVITWPKLPEVVLFSQSYLQQPRSKAANTTDSLQFAADGPIKVSYFYHKIFPSFLHKAILVLLSTLSEPRLLFLERKNNNELKKSKR